MRVQPNALNQSVFFYVIDADGAPVTASALNTGMPDIIVWYQTGAAVAPVDESLLLLAANTTAHTDNYGRAIDDGIVRVDLPDAPWASGASSVRVWLDLSSVDAGYSVAGGFVDVQLGYSLQNPDSSTTALARETTVQAALTTIDANVDTINVSTGVTIPALITTVDGVADSTLAVAVATQSSVGALTSSVNSGTFGLEVTKTAVDALPDAAAIQAAAAAAIVAKLPSGASEIAAAGTTVKTLEDVEGGGSGSSTVPAITQRIHKPNLVEFGRRTDGWYRATRPIHIAVGEAPVVAADMAKWGDMVWTAMSAPTTSDATVASPGDVASSTYGISTTQGTPSFKLTPHADAEDGDTCVITVLATADGQPVRLDFDVEVVAGAVE